MSNPGQFITWQPVLTDHQAFTLAELARQAGVPVIAYVTALEDSTRRKQGWSDTQVSGIERHLIPSSRSWLYCHRKLLHHRNDTHIFCGTFQSPLLIYCLIMATWLNIKPYLISEPYCPVAQSYFRKRPGILDQLKATLRPILYRFYAGFIKTKIQGIFSISQLALHQYSKAGVASEKLFPFGYFIPVSVKTLRSARRVQDQHELRVVFVGSLITIKGLDTLVEAMHLLHSRKSKITLDIFGPGDPNLFSLNQNNIRYCGQIPFGSTQEVVAHYDLLVLPSLYDGWGVVINEALCAGVPVICSDRVGAGVLINTFHAGMTFKSSDALGLANCLSMLATEQNLLVGMQQATTKAAASIQPERAASYMLQVFHAPDGEKGLVPSPWYPF